MVYKVSTSHRAQNDMLEIGKYIATQLHAPESASKLLDDMENEIADLNTMPKRFALVSDERLAQMGIRSVPVKNYSIFYTVDEQEESVIIISVMYSKRNWANLL